LDFASEPVFYLDRRGVSVGQEVGRFIGRDENEWRLPVGSELQQRDLKEGEFGR
jgi:hypothetical protein